MTTIDEFFEGHAISQRLYEAVALGETTVHIGRSQIAFKRRRTVAAVWMPQQYLDDQVRDWLRVAWDAAG